MYFPVYIIKVLSAFCIFSKPLKSSFSLDFHMFIFFKFIFARTVAIIICYSNTRLCFFLNMSFCCNLCRYSFWARQFIKQIHLKYWHFPLCRWEVLSKMHQVIWFKPLQLHFTAMYTSFPSFHGILLIRTLVRHLLKIETYKTQVIYVSVG